MSPQKHAAQIANAQLSSGPRTEQGKRRSAGNSTRHGLASRKLQMISPHERAEFDQHCAEMLAALAPQGAIERQLADAVVFDQWRLTRARALESEIFARGFMRAKDELFSGAETWTAQAKNLALLTLYEQRINRVLARNTAQLDSLQTARKATPRAESISETAAQAQTAAAQKDVAPQQAAQSTTQQGSAGFVHSPVEIANSHRPSFPVEEPVPAPGPVPIVPESLRQAA